MKEIKIKPGMSIDASEAKIDTYSVPTVVADFENFCNTRIEVGTTGFKGGDSGHGSRTVFRISDLSCTDMRGGIKGKHGKCGVDAGGDDIDKIEIAFGGDAELENFVDALEFAITVLCGQANIKRDLFNVDDNTIIEELKKRGYGIIDPIMKPKNNLSGKENTFLAYLIELIKTYKETGSLRGMGFIREKYAISGITKDIFYKSGLASIQDADWLNSPEGNKFVSHLYYKVCKKEKDVRNYVEFLNVKK